MKQSSVFLTIILILISSTIISPQNKRKSKNLNSRKKENVRKNDDEKIIIHEADKIKQRNPRSIKKESKKYKDKKYSVRIPRINNTRKKIKKTTNVEKIDQFEFMEVYSSDNVIKQVNVIGKCDFKKYHDSDEISKFGIPNFPLRFEEAMIDYIFTLGDDDYFKITCIIKPTFGNYSEKFGIKLKCFSDVNFMIVFNNDQDILLQGDHYKFSNLIKNIPDGYLNMRLGYYNEDYNKFIPEPILVGKTDKLIYVEKGLSIYLNE